MQLTIEQRTQLESGRLIRFVIPESNIECVMLRSDRLLQPADDIDLGPCHSDELMALVAEQFDDEDWTLPDDRGRPHERSTN